VHAECILKGRSRHTIGRHVDKDLTGVVGITALMSCDVRPCLTHPCPDRLDGEDEETTMTDSTRSSYRQRSASQASAGGGNAVYGLGLIGALVFFWQQADSFGEYLLAILKALVWPAFLVYEAFHGLLG
jgi:hypothetical protein